MIDEKKLDALFENLQSRMGLLFYGSSGLGKTWQTKRLSTKFNVPMFNSYAEMSKYDGKKASRMILFHDEAQKMSLKEQENLLLVIDMDAISFRNYRGKSYETSLTHIFASTDPNKVILPIRTRCLAVTFPYCTEEDIFTIMRPVYKEISDDDLVAVSNRCKCNPRQADHLCRMFIKMGYEVFNALDIDEYGLNQMEREYLVQLDTKGDCSLVQLANSLGLSTEAIIEMIEPYYRQRGIIEITSKGRKLSDYGRDFAKNINRAE